MESSNSHNFRVPSITEWMEKIKLSNIFEFRHEDNTKYERMAKLNAATNIKYHQPIKIAISEIGSSPIFFFLKNESDKNIKYTWRVIPKTPEFPKHRVRYISFEDGWRWFKGKNIQPENYSHLELLKYEQAIAFSAVILINNLGIWGEAIDDELWKLASGIHEKQTVVFNNNFKECNFYPNNKNKTRRLVSRAINYLKISGNETKKYLCNYLNSEFTKEGYLKGYFEFIAWPNDEIVLMDYNRVLYRMFKNYNFHIIANNNSLAGLGASPGVVEGKAKIVNDPIKDEFLAGEILICKLPTIDYLPLIQRAAAIITEQGNILSHFSIICRELKKPCIVGINNVTGQIQDGERLLLNADEGTVIKL